MKCEVCGREKNVHTFGSFKEVCCSFVEFETDVCEDCLEKREYIYQNAVSKMELMEYYEAFPEIKARLIALCHINDKDEMDFDADVRKYEAEFLDWCRMEGIRGIMNKKDRGFLTDLEAIGLIKGIIANIERVRGEKIKIIYS